MKIQIVLKPVENFATTPFFVSEFFKHLLDNWCSNRVDYDLTFFIHESLVQITEWCDAWPQTHLNSGTQTAPDVYTTIVILEFRLRSQELTARTCADQRVS